MEWQIANSIRFCRYLARTWHRLNDYLTGERWSERESNNMSVKKGEKAKPTICNNQLKNVVFRTHAWNGHLNIEICDSFNIYAHKATIYADSEWEVENERKTNAKRGRKWVQCEVSRVENDAGESDKRMAKMKRNKK